MAPLKVSTLDRLCFDVFQTILSFLPPIPYLFQLQRVSKSWSELCRECMQEECSELYWDDTLIFVLPNTSTLHDDDDDHSESDENLNNNTTERKQQFELLMNLIERTFKRKQQSDWFLFFRKVLKHFRKLDRLILKNMDFNDPLFYLLMCEWRGRVKKLSLVNCSFKLTNEMFPRRNIESFAKCEFDMDQCCGGKYLKMGMDGCEIEDVSLSYLNYSWIDTDKDTQVSSLCVLKCFPKLKKISSFLSEDKSIKKEQKRFLEAFPNVEFQYDSYTKAEILLKKTKDLELVINFHFNELVTKYNMRKNRLEQYKTLFLTDEEKLTYFHEKVKNIYQFLHFYSYFSLDSNTKDMRGRNVINYALMHSELSTVQFIIHYLAIGDKDTARSELNKLFSANNKVDGTNAIIPFVKMFNRVDLLIEYGISMNHRSQDGSTLAHYLCNYGKRPIIEEIEKTLKDIPPKERMCYFDIRLKNNKNETCLDVCLREGNQWIYERLKNSEILKPPPTPSTCLLL